MAANTEPRRRPPCPTPPQHRQVGRSASPTTWCPGTLCAS